MTKNISPPEEVALFVTCLIDIARPVVGHAILKVLRAAGVKVVVPPQVCCGQPNFNAGDRAAARNVALQVIDLFTSYSKVIVPSGSCGGMIIRHYPALFESGSLEHTRACELAGKTEEFVTFLVRRGIRFSPNNLPNTKITYHDACSGLRELGIKAAPRQLLSGIPSLTLCEMQSSEVCCGFGGTFSINHAEISNRMVENKVADIRSTTAEIVVSGDMGCLLNIEGKLLREKSAIEVRHIAEVLAAALPVVD